MQIIRRDPEKGYLDTRLWVPKKHVNEDGVKRALTFSLADASVLSLWKETEHHILVPREFWAANELAFEIVDCRPRSYPSVTLQSRIKLDHRPDEQGILKPTGEMVQEKALHALLSARGGILQLACGKGKTVIFLELVVRLGVPTLIVLDNTQLLEQWRAEVEKHLIVPGGVGLIQGDVFDWQKAVVLTTYQTLSARADVFPEPARRWFGLVGWDEGHHSGAQTFSRTLDIFPCRRVLLTATPDRIDGLHVVYRFHVGQVVYKDLKPEMIPRICFLWTGFSVNMADPIVAAQVKDRTGELHLRKLAGFFGRCRSRLNFVLEEIKKIHENGRRVLVISESIEELANLIAAWNNNTQSFSEIPRPTAAEVADIDRQERALALLQLNALEQKVACLDPESDKMRLKKLEERLARLRERLREPPLTKNTPAISLLEKEQRRLHKQLQNIAIQLKDRSINPVKYEKLLEHKKDIELRFLQHAMARATQTELERRQRAFIHTTLEQPSSAGLLIEEVDAKTRLRFVKEKMVIFSIAKYGREGLDNPDIDTVFVCEPFSSRNILQQLMGRPSRRRPNKKTPVFVVLEDDVGPCIGMCVKLRQHLRDWPEDEGGPFKYELIGHPKAGQRGVRHG